MALSPIAARSLIKGFAFLLLFTESSGSHGWSLAGPKSYDECILENMKGVTDRLAAISIMGSCARQFPDTINKPSADTYIPQTQNKPATDLQVYQTPSGREIRARPGLTQQELADKMRTQNPKDAPLFGFSPITLEQFMSTPDLEFIFQKVDSKSKILLSKIPCDYPELIVMGFEYGYAFFEPASRIKSPNDAYSIENGKAMTVRGCWVRTGAATVRWRGLRLSDKQYVDVNDNISYSEWYGFK